MALLVLLSIVLWYYSKVNFESNKIPKCFWDLHDETLALLKTKGGCDTFFNFLLKMTSWACLLGSRLKLIFYWKAQSLSFFKSLFSSFAEVVMSCVTENRDASSANNFALEDRAPDKSFMYIKNNNGPKMEPWRTPAVTFCYSDVWPLRRTLCFLWLKELDKRSKRLSDIPFCDNLKRRPLGHTLSKALEMSKKTLLNSNPSSNEL